MHTAHSTLQESEREEKKIHKMRSHANSFTTHMRDDVPNNTYVRLPLRFMKCANANAAWNFSAFFCVSVFDFKCENKKKQRTQIQRRTSWYGIRIHIICFIFIYALIAMLIVNVIERNRDNFHFFLSHIDRDGDDRPSLKVSTIIHILCMRSHRTLAT